MREWLNGTFYENAFNAEEKQRIATTLLENVWNPWNVLAEYEYTEDKVFLPSMEDMLSGDYFYTEKAPESAAADTGYILLLKNHTCRLPAPC